MKNELCLLSVLKVAYTLWRLSKDLHLSRICNYGILANLRECRRAENMFSVFYCFNSSRLEYDQYSWFLVQLQKYFWASVLIHTLSGEVLFLLARKKKYCFSCSWVERFILSKLTFIALPNVHANTCYLIRTDRAHLGATIVFGQWNFRTSKN